MADRAFLDQRQDRRLETAQVPQALETNKNIFIFLQDTYFSTFAVQIPNESDFTVANYYQSLHLTGGLKAIGNISNRTRLLS
jgi:hypothetical protein